MKVEKETNLDKVKEIAIAFLNLPLVETELGLAFVQHPFFSSAIIPVDKGGKYELSNILEDEAAYIETLKKYRQHILEVTVIHNVWYMILPNYRLTFLKYIKESLSEKDFSILLADAWITAENPNGDPNVPLRTAISWFTQADKKSLMSEADYKTWEALPDIFQIYRGVSVGRNPRGLSWTRNLGTAKWFANRFNTKTQTGYIQTATILKNQALAYFNTRKEDELVVDTTKLDIRIWTDNDTFK